LHALTTLSKWAGKNIDLQCLRYTQSFYNKRRKVTLHPTYNWNKGFADFHRLTWK
jgi:hypothetical protein